MSEASPSPGQRWISKTEPELGLGLLMAHEPGKVTILFRTAGEKRIYSLDSAPILRVRFKEGDKVPLHDGSLVEISGATESEGLINYETSNSSFPETDLADSITFSRPEDRLLSGQVDDLRSFDLRMETHLRSSFLRKSPVRGLLGGRIDLIPHQISIVREVSSRPAPRVLLADEVGLGKTIEACLIMHRLHLTGRADRVLILVPEPLLHQWFVELLRRFNLLFALFDEERCQSITRMDPKANPFLNSQLVLCSPDFLLAHPHRLPQLFEAGWDCLIVDEAHHLEWSPEEPGEAYEMVEELARETPSVLLLTATPQQLGAEGHFARLKLLDPARFTDLAAFNAESADYEKTGDLIETISSGGQPNKADIARYARLSPRIESGLRDLSSEESRQKVIRDLVDSFGTGRVMFRNTRKQLQGFPERKAHLIELEGDEMEARLDWLVSFLKANPEQKILLICKTIDLVEDIAGGLLDRITVKLAQFHEELTLLQRDRNAAYFSEEDGASLLICSEIGSEGRNFQFAHHLVLFDLPENPELLEQRIGRLDRIGQSETIHIHVPYIAGSRGERYARWYHEGLNAFEKNLQGAQTLVKRLQELKTDTLAEFISASQGLRAETEAELERGHDRLLALSSSRADDVEKTLSQMEDADHDRAFEGWVMRLFDHFALDVSDLGNRTYLVKQGNVITDAFPDLPEEGQSVTFDRHRALSREDLGFMSADHPMLGSGIDLLLASEAGNSSFAVWETPGDKNILLEACFVVECVAPPALQADRFLPPTPLRLVTNLQQEDLSANKALIKASLRMGASHKLLNQPKVTRELIPGMIETLNGLADERALLVIRKALKAMEQALDDEHARLADLAQVNPDIGEDDLSAILVRKEELTRLFKTARPRLDALRLIYKAPPA